MGVDVLEMSLFSLERGLPRGFLSLSPVALPQNSVAKGPSQGASSSALDV